MPDTLTPKYSFIKPEVGGSDDTWGGKLNGNFDIIDTYLGGMNASDTPPATPKEGQLWWDSNSGVMYIWYNDGDSSQWVQISGDAAPLDRMFSTSADLYYGFRTTPNRWVWNDKADGTGTDVMTLSETGVLSFNGKAPVFTAESRNRIVNPAMQISQENGDTASASGATGAYYTADQWNCRWSATGAAAVAGGTSATSSPNGSRVTSTNVSTPKGSLAAGDYFLITYTIEGVRVKDFLWGTAQARQVVVRFWIKAATAGQYSVAVVNAAAARTYLAPFTITAALTWQEVVLVIPGDTTGAWPTTAVLGLRLEFVRASGANFLGVAGWQAGEKFAVAGQTNGFGAAGIFDITDVGLYLDPDNTGLPPKWEMPDEAEELRACQRYWSGSAPPDTWIYAHPRATNDTYRVEAIPLPVQMRTAPAALAYGSIDGGGLIGLGVDVMRPDVISVAHNIGNATSSLIVRGWTANARM